MAGLRLRKVRVRFERPRFEMGGLGRVLGEGFGGLRRLRAGARVAVGTGSRGVANIGEITLGIVSTLKGMGYEPFIVPAMGSHGGGTAEGQVEVLASYGITEEGMACAVRSSMEVVDIGAEGLEHRVYMDRLAWEADGAVVVNRIKPHTDFRGRYESGLAKMAVIGLGKKKQAEIMHGFGVRGLRDLVRLAAERVIGTGKIWAGVGIVENAYDETAAVEVMGGEEILAREPGLLEMARRNMPRLPAEELDVLLVDELGKNISGTGMDTGIIGRMKIVGEVEPAVPRIRAIAVFDLTEVSHGNAVGVGLADVITEKLRGKIDYGVMRTNVVTSGFMERGKVPVALGTDREAFEVALRMCGGVGVEGARVMRVRNTLELGEVWVSEAMEGEMKLRGDVEFAGGYEDVFDGEGSARKFG